MNGGGVALKALEDLLTHWAACVRVTDSRDFILLGLIDQLSLSEERKKRVFL